MRRQSNGSVWVLIDGANDGATDTDASIDTSIDELTGCARYTDPYTALHQQRLGFLDLFHDHVST
jgi:hypothetical protein